MACVTGIAVAISAACATHKPATEGPMAQDVETPIILFLEDSTCKVSAKQTQVTAHQDKWLEFEVVNYCDSPQVVMVGNFHDPKGASVPTTDCQNAGERIFQQDDERRRTANLPAGSASDPEDGQIRLKIRKEADLPRPLPLESAFDVCLNGVKADPVLVVRR